MKIIIKIIIASILLLTGYTFGVTKAPETIEKEVIVEKIIEVPVEVVVEKQVEVPVEKIKTVTIKENIPCSDIWQKRYEAQQTYIIETINSYTPDEAVMRIQDSINPPDWKK
jgi:hypothetical protein